MDPSFPDFCLWLGLTQRQFFFPQILAYLAFVLKCPPTYSCSVVLRLSKSPRMGFILKHIHTHSLSLILKCNSHAQSLSLSAPPSQPPSLLILTPSPISSLEQLHRSQHYIFQLNCLGGTDLPKTLQALLPISAPENPDLSIGPQRTVSGVVLHFLHLLFCDSSVILPQDPESLPPSNSTSLCWKHFLIFFSLLLLAISFRLGLLPLCDFL